MPIVPSRSGRGQGVDQLDFELAGLPGNLVRPDALDLESLIHPRDEEEVARPPLERPGSREHQLGEPVPNDAETKLVASPLLAKEFERVEHAAALRLGVIDPREHGRRHRPSRDVR